MYFKRQRALCRTKSCTNRAIFNCKSSVRQNAVRSHALCHYTYTIHALCCAVAHVYLWPMWSWRCRTAPSANRENIELKIGLRSKKLSLNLSKKWSTMNAVEWLHVRDGNESVGYGSNGSPFLDGSRGSWVTASDPLTHDDEITAQ